MGLVDVFTSVLIGVVLIFMGCWILYVIWWIMKNTGMLKTVLAIPIVKKVLKIKDNPKSDDEVQEEIVNAIRDADDSAVAFAKLLSTKNYFEKEQYLNAYSEIQTLLKGGKNETRSKGKDIKDEEVPRPIKS